MGDVGMAGVVGRVRPHPNLPPLAGEGTLRLTALLDTGIRRYGAWRSGGSLASGGPAPGAIAPRSPRIEYGAGSSISPFDGAQDRLRANGPAAPPLDPGLRRDGVWGVLEERNWLALGAPILTFPRSRGKGLRPSPPYWIPASGTGQASRGQALPPREWGWGMLGWRGWLVASAPILTFPRSRGKGLCAASPLGSPACVRGGSASAGMTPYLVRGRL